MKFSRKSFDDYYLDNLVHLDRKTKILDYGCGDGRLINKSQKLDFQNYEVLMLLDCGHVNIINIVTLLTMKRN